MQDTGIIILAAGSSSRLGTAKQLLDYQHKPLVQHAVEQALSSDPACVIVVVGADAEAVAGTLVDHDVKICYNDDWSTGMASSIRKGIEALLNDHPLLTRCIFSVCDQPFLEAHHFMQLHENQLESQKGIIASAYADTLGVPVLFSNFYFPLLQQLQGDQGAKKIITAYPDDVVSIAFADGAVDIDEPADLKYLMPEMVSVSEANAIIKKHTHFVRTGIKTLGEALGYTIAEEVISKYDIPGFRQSSMDGYALKFEDRNNRLEIVGEMRAGKQSDVTLLSGQAMRVFTGAPIPTAADTVVMQERVYRDGDWMIVADEHLTIGMHVREKGSEAAKGTWALAQGTVLTPAALGFLAGIGCEKLLIFEPPKVAIIVTGDELQEVGQPLSFGQVYDSNSIQLRAALQKAGIETVQVFHAADDPAALEKILGQALLASDLVLLVGGVSVGDYDFVVQSALAQSVRPHFHKVKQKPGKPLFFGTTDETVVFGLPGNPSSALTCFYLYVLPAIDRMMQRPDSVSYGQAVTTVDYPKNSGLTHFIKAHLMDGKILPLHAQESYRLQSYAQANCLLVIPEESTGIVAGEEVQVIVLP